MATLRKRKGKWTVEIRRKGHRNVYGTFVHKSDARSFVHKVESEITQNKYKDISEAATTTFKVALQLKNIGMNSNYSMLMLRSTL